MLRSCFSFDRARASISLAARSAGVNLDPRFLPISGWGGAGVSFLSRSNVSDITMSNTAPFFRKNSSFDLNIGTGPVPSPVMYMGLNLDPVGAVYSVLDGTPTGASQSLPVDADGRLVVSLDPVARVTQGTPYSATGGVCVAVAAGEYADQGCTFTLAGSFAQT